MNPNKYASFCISYPVLFLFLFACILLISILCMYFYWRGSRDEYKSWTKPIDEISKI